ncbi:endo alpha-1,4 polygalactosaminidase [Nannocystis sp. ILAH1]|uniref:endo alpha-1,4 polygalactosaminidase n=1 Tax=Nannocystis sp. ILAH1 TaxID=2996789 RepID=UPI0022708207|nr:endo alpha-1,4 polygalactosaminidase [Nannocystis sp. ILAH1]MCY0987087.1 endo alpha-1,4 polygalactosaminidase [Nannocystis sp. ILAH1]
MTRRSQVWSLSALLFGACTGSGSDDSSGAPATDTDATTEPGTAADATTEGTDTSTGVPTSGTTDDPTGATASTTVDPTGQTVTGTTDDPGTSTGPTSETTDGTTGAVEALLPPPDGEFDYQLGESYDPPMGVTIVSRDRNAAPAPGLYNICYVNGFQVQPDEEDFWLDDHPDLVLRDGMGNPVIDQDWDEMLLDTSTPEKRAALAEIVGGWIAACGTDGFDAIEIDNLDSYSRSKKLLTQDDAVAYMALLSAAAHAENLAIAQKNSTELLDRKEEMGTDFAVAEECNTYEECGDYIGAYGDAVLMIEYVEADFTTGCEQYPQMSIVLRDLDLVAPGSPGYVREAC